MSRVGGLEVFAMQNGEPGLLPSNSERYLLVEAIIHLALGVVETPAGRDSLVQVATIIVNHRNDPPGKRKPKPVPHIYKYPLEEMPQWIDSFIQRIRSNFPQVTIYPMEADAAAIRQDWGNDMNQWDPKVAGYMYVNEVIIHNMAHIRRQPPDIAGDNYNKLKFQMVISVVHEMVHFITGYLTGQSTPATPPTVTLERYGTARMGEAGRYWEGRLLGGIVEFYQDSNDALGPRQAGIPWLIQDGRNNVVARMVSMSYINRFLNGNFSFPVGTSNAVPATDRNGLRSASTEMSFVRKKASRNMPPYEPLEATSSGSVSYRGLPQDPSYSGGDYAPQSTYGNTQYGSSQYGNSQYGSGQNWG